MRANPERRRRIADAAIQILARSGANGLSHRAVDAEAGLPRGTTSNFFNTRQALLVAAAQRLLETHRQWVRSLRDEIDGPLDRERLAAILHRLVVAEDQALRVRHLARYELFLAGLREPGLQPVLIEVRKAALETAVLLLESAGLPEPRRHVDLLSSVLTGLTFDHLTAPSGSLSATETTAGQVLDLIFDPQPARQARAGASRAR